jgi:Bacterial Ig-like domain
MKHTSVKSNATWFGVKLLSLVGTIFLTLVACDTSSNPTPPEPSGDATPPSIVSITPTHGAIGVTKDSNIIITFSEAMDQARTEQAFQAAEIPGFSFSWNADETVLTVDPASNLEYTFDGKVYNFSLSTGATDLAGNVLQGAPVGSSFLMLVLNKVSLFSVASADGTLRDGDGAINPAASCDEETICVGDSGAVATENESYLGFLSFDLSSLPENLTEIVEAELRVTQTQTDFNGGSPYTDLGNLLWDHVFYDVLDADDFAIPALTASGQLLSASAANESKTTEVTSALQDDWENRAARDNRSQYRLRFTEETDNNGDTDVAFFTSGEGVSTKPRLEITYLTIENSGDACCLDARNNPQSIALRAVRR